MPRRRTPASSPPPRGRPCWTARPAPVTPPGGRTATAAAGPSRHATDRAPARRRAEPAGGTRPDVVSSKRLATRPRARSARCGRAAVRCRAAHARTGHAWAGFRPGGLGHRHRARRQRGELMSGQEATTAGPDLNWLLDDFGARVEHFRQAVILSRDGLTIAASANLRRDSAEHLSALAAGVQSLGRGAGE